MAFKGSASEATTSWDNVGVLLVNLGTPESPTAPALRRYLREFLSDPRVVEIPRPVWWLILNAVVLPFRPKRLIAPYQSIWTEQGSPLLVIAKRQTAAIVAQLAARGLSARVELAMSYGEPSIASGLARLKQARVGRVLVLPLYPQYSSSTAAPVFDLVFRELMTWRRMPALSTITDYHQHPGYIAALAESVREYWQSHGRPDRLLMSFHGTPLSYFQQGDPYYTQCKVTAQHLASALGLNQDQWILAFQSRFSKAEWLQPYTSATLSQLPSQSVKRVDVICPGFSADCLETLEEIQKENREVFLHAGGSEYHYIPALNDRSAHISFLCDLIAEEL